MQHELRVQAGAEARFGKCTPAQHYNHGTRWTLPLCYGQLSQARYSSERQSLSTGPGCPAVAPVTVDQNATGLKRSPAAPQPALALWISGGMLWGEAPRPPPPPGACHHLPPRRARALPSTAFLLSHSGGLLPAPSAALWAAAVQPDRVFLAWPARPQGHLAAASGCAGAIWCPPTRSPPRSSPLPSSPAPAAPRQH